MMGPEVGHATGVPMRVASSDGDIGCFSSKTGLVQLPGQGWSSCQAKPEGVDKEVCTYLLAVISPEKRVGPRVCKRALG